MACIKILNGIHTGMVLFFLSDIFNIITTFIYFSLFQIEKDFNHLYPTSGDQLISNWEKIKATIKKLFKLQKLRDDTIQKFGKIIFDLSFYVPQFTYINYNFILFPQRIQWIY